MTDGTVGVNGAAGAVKQYFVGKYIESMRDVYLASLLGGLNAVAIGAPGFGKTDVALSLLGDIFGVGQFTFTRLSPSSPVEMVEGAVDISRLMNVSEFTRNVAGTPMDTNLKAHLVDEIFRANAMVLQSLMFVTDRKDVRHPAPVLATANFLPKGDEFEALLDRFSLWCWVEPSPADAGAIARAKLLGGVGILHVQGTLPTAAEIEEVKRAAEQPGLAAVEAVAGVVEQLASDAAAEGLQANPRRITAWAHLLYRSGVYYAGSADFKNVPAAAMKLLRFAWRSASAEEGRRWAQIAASVTDPVAAVVEQALADGAEVVNTAVDAMTGIANQGQKFTLLGEASTKLQSIQKTLNALGTNDPRILEANNTIMGWFGALAGGRKVER